MCACVCVCDGKANYLSSCLLRVCVCVLKWVAKEVEREKEEVGKRVSLSHIFACVNKVIFSPSFSFSFFPSLSLSLLRTVVMAEGKGEDRTAAGPTCSSGQDFPKIIDLNVGGTYYSTTLDTLRSDPDSMLCAMFSGRVGVLTDKDHRYFIDRDGNLFRYVLSFLRFGRAMAFHLSFSFPPPASFSLLISHFFLFLLLFFNGSSPRFSFVYSFVYS